MATSFEFWIDSDEFSYARQASLELGRLLVEIEKELSFYIEESDISRINALREGETILIGEHVRRILSQSTTLTQETSGAFDPNVGEVMKTIKDAQGNVFNRFWDCDHAPLLDFSGRGLLVMDEENRTITRVGKERVSLDLGAIGKGYALDQLGLLLREWDLPCFLLSGGGSSLLAGEQGESKWEVNFAGRSFVMKNQAMGASGIPIKGVHIIDPRSGKPSRCYRTWVLSHSATRADALSTAAMILPDSWIESHRERFPEEVFCIQKNEAQAPHFFGAFPIE